MLRQRTRLGLYVRGIGADAQGALKAGIPVRATTFTVFIVCGGFAGFAGFISMSQTSSASGAFGQNAEFLAIAAAVLGGTSLFGSRGTLFALIVGAILIMSKRSGSD